MRVATMGMMAAVGATLLGAPSLGVAPMDLSAGAMGGGLLASLPEALPAWAFAAMVLLARIGCTCMLLPGIGEAELPMTVRAGFVVAFVGLMLPVLGPEMPPMPGDVSGLFAVLAAEVVTGLWLGWLVRLILLAPAMAGQLIAGAIGMTNVIQPDPMLGAGTAALSRLLGLAAPVVVLASGLHAYPLMALVGSYQLVQPGHVLPVGDTVAAYVDELGGAFGIGLRLAAPFMLAGAMFHGVVGVISRLVPHLQTHFAAMPGQTIGGLVLLAVLAAAMMQAWMGATHEAFNALPGL